MAAHRYWRITFTAFASGALGPTLSTAEMRLVAGGTNLALTGNGTASASDVGNGAAANAFDGVGTTLWGSTAGTVPQWLQWDFGLANAQDIAEVILANGSNATPAYNAITGFISYSDDNSIFVTWSSFVNRTTAVSTSSTHTIDVISSILVSGSLPMLTAALQFGLKLSAVLPTPLVAVVSSGAINAALPSAVLSVNLGNRLESALPMPTIVVSGGAGIANAVNALMPTPVVAMQLGDMIVVSMPMAVVQAFGTTTNSIQVAATLPLPTILIGETVGSLLVLSAELPMIQGALLLGAQVASAMPMVQVLAVGTRGALIHVVATLPSLSATIRVSKQIEAFIALVMPRLLASPFGRIVSVLPMGVVTMTGRMVVAVTYEAYAINLNPVARYREQPANEVTHYTNYPFDQIVRWNNSYYGVNATGVYLLEIAASDGVALPWAIKTHLDDFKDPFKKTVLAARFAGRMGPAATVTLYVGESSAQAHTYTTPRDATPRNYRQKFGRGIKARYYALGMTGDQDLTLDEVEPEIIKTTRRM